MTEHEVEANPVTKVARDLTEILRMCDALEDQAEHKANARIDGTGLPGGLAMVDLGHVGSPSEWAEQVAADELYHLSTCTRLSHEKCHYAQQAADEDEQTEPPLQTLLFWSEAWREEHGYPLEGRRPTVASEANLIRSLLNWAWDNEPHFEDMARDVNAARVKLENVLYAGNRQERSRIICPDCEPLHEKDKGVRLLVNRGTAADGSDDEWKCPRCKRRFDSEGVRKAHAKMLRSQGAERWLHQVDAIGTLKAQGRPERTVRQWLADGEGTAYCDPKTHEVWVWWPDLWRRHLSTPQRQRSA